MLTAITKDLARPPVHARNLFHVSAAMYDAWSAYDVNSEPFLLGRTIGNYTNTFDGVAQPAEIEVAREEAISYAAYRILKHRFQNSPGASSTLPALDTLMVQLGYDRNYTSTDYVSEGPAALGNYIAQEYINMGYTDGSNEAGNYAHLYYTPVNPPIAVEQPGDPTIIDPNRWQQISVSNAVDQNGNPVIGTPPPVGHEWGNVIPFSMDPTDAVDHQRDGNTYRVYHDPGPPALLDTNVFDGLTSMYKWSFCMVPIWASHLDPEDPTTLDISPASLGNLSSYPSDPSGYATFYDFFDGGDNGPGLTLNPVTGAPYTPQVVKRGDYARILAEFWADGPNSETPPGHWFSILHAAQEHPLFSRRWMGVGPELDELEYDVKAYLALGGAMHDAAITAWSIKGWYDYVRPVSAIRYMSDKGQCTDPDAPHYHAAGLPLVPGYIEQVTVGDPLAGDNNEHVDKIKLFTWRGPSYVEDPDIDHAGVGWILAENWWPYQRPSFVTPPFAGYVSGHSTYSRTAAEVLTSITGTPYFPGGLGVFQAPANDFLVFEEGPSEDIELEWATYRDASDQCSLSRIWGGIHPPVDDIPGRLAGIILGPEVVDHASALFTSTRPSVVTVNVSDEVVNIADIGSTLTISIGFDRAMDTGEVPLISYLGDDPTLTALTLQSEGWSDAQTYSVTYEIESSTATFQNINLRVGDARADDGQLQNVQLFADVFILDTESPQIASAEPSISLINDVAADGFLEITVEMNEACDVGVPPILDFNGGDLSTVLSFDAGSSGWMSASQYIARFTIEDTGVEIADIGIMVNGIVDAAGNPGTEFQGPSALTIDTRNPVISPLAPDDPVLSLLDVGSSALTIVLDFDETMDTTIFPDLTFPLDDPTITSLQTSLANTAWISSTTFRKVYDLSNANEQLFNILAEIVQARDLAGNAPETTQFPDLFTVDTKQAQVSTTDPMVSVVNNANVGLGGFHVDIEYDEPMDAAFSPLVQITSTDPIGNSFVHSTGQSQWTDASTYRAAFNVNDEEREATDLTLSISFARDVSGNIQLPISVNGVFALDTKDPTLLVTTSNTYDITGSNTGTTGFSVLSIFSEPMDTEIAPVLLFDPPIPQDVLALNEGASEWLNSTAYQWRYDVGTVYAEVDPVAITISAARDQAENSMVDSTDPAYFSISLLVGIAEVGGSIGLDAYPNPVPSGASLMLTVPRSMNDVTIELIDVQGRIIRKDPHRSISAGTFEYPLSRTVSGLYLLRLTSPSFVGHVKLQLQ
jgi:hypothetical protein